MPVPKGLTDIVGDVPYFLAGAAYAKANPPRRLPDGTVLAARTLKFPTSKGTGDIMQAMGPEQLKEVYEAGRSAWDEMVKTWGLELPPWVAWLMCCAITCGGAYAMDKMEQTFEAIRSMPPSPQKDAVIAHLKTAGVTVPGSAPAPIKRVPDVPEGRPGAENEAPVVTV